MVKAADEGVDANVKYINVHVLIDVKEMGVMSEHMTEKDLIVDYMKSCTVEVTPGGAEKIASFPELLRTGTTVYVTFLPGSDFADTVKVVKRLRAEGMNPVPHFAARSIPSKGMSEGVPPPK